MLYKYGNVHMHQQCDVLKNAIHPRMQCNCCPNAGLDAQSVLHKFGKGKPIPAIIEAVSSGASLRATLLPDQYFVSVMLVGIVCPSFNRRPTGQSAAAPAANGHAPGQAAESSDSAEPATNGTAGKCTI